MKMELALNNLQRLICHKTNQLTRQDLTQGHFIMESYVRIETQARLVQKMLDLAGIPFWGGFRRQAMNSAVHSRYCLGGRPPGTSNLISLTRRERQEFVIKLLLTIYYKNQSKFII